MTYTINPGEMRTQITLQSPTITQDAGGAQVQSYANVSPNPVVYARWINAHGAEVVASDALESTQRAAVTIRHRTDIKETWRVLKNSEAWQIISIDPVRDQRRFIELIVERVKGSV
jgi:SPP1 family predicted phage head-tail adaptor